MGIFGYIKEKVLPNKEQKSGVALVQKGKISTVSILTNDDNYSERQAKYKKFKRAYERVPMVSAQINTTTDHVIQSFFFDGPSKEKLT